jgi:hypothetical protein
LDRCDLRPRSARVQQFSPDPEYASKLTHLEMALWEARRYPRSVAAVFLDQMGFTRWPDPAPDWGSEPPVADRRGAKQGLGRLMGALNPLSGQVNYLDNYLIGREKVIACYGQLVEAYPRARRLYAIQDNWSIHRHPDVLEALQAWPPIEPVWLPTYAPWLNPIEKLWRWLRQDVLKLHRLAGAARPGARVPRPVRAWLAAVAGVRWAAEQRLSGADDSWPMSTDLGRQSSLGRGRSARQGARLPLGHGGGL